MKSLRESFIPQNRATEAVHYPGYVIRLQKERQIHARSKPKYTLGNGGTPPPPVTTHVHALLRVETSPRDDP